MSLRLQLLPGRQDSSNIFRKFHPESPIVRRMPGQSRRRLQPVSPGSPEALDQRPLCLRMIYVGFLVHGKEFVTIGVVHPIEALKPVNFNGRDRRNLRLKRMQRRQAGIKRLIQADVAERRHQFGCGLAKRRHRPGSCHWIPKPARTTSIARGDSFPHALR